MSTGQSNYKNRKTRKKFIGTSPTKALTPTPQLKGKGHGHTKIIHTIKTNVFQNNFFCIFGILYFFGIFVFCNFFWHFSVFAEFVGDLMYSFWIPV